ncbi:MAG: DNA mismatch repair endonuclease MutL [Anaerolineales bacterium]
MPIHILPESVSSAIAAGEVVERPASVVKELIENAIDAGATRIEIRTEGGGIKRIAVYDDGSGIEADELPLAVARFATSKLDSAEDLAAIGTLGFRGEALASIGAVARLRVQSRTVNADAGAMIEVDGGEIGRVEPLGTAQGTLVQVSNLFFNVPARRKFLKAETTEKRWISTLVSRYAMAYPQIHFKLEQDGRLNVETSGSGNPREVITQVFGLEIGRALIEIEPVSGPVGATIHGFISPPSITRSNRREITFFVNGRWIQDASLAAAVTQAYHTLLMVGRYPLVVLYLDVPPAEIDVNVHPAKAEIRFENPAGIFSLVQRNVRAALIGQAPAPDLALRWPETAVHGRAGGVEPAWHLAGSFGGSDREHDHVALQPALPAGGVPLLRPVGQIGASYLVAEGPDGMYLIDQHAAHERVLFDRMMELRREGAIESQRLLAPVVVEMTPSQAELLDSQWDLLPKLGFEVEEFGTRTYRVRAIPAVLGARDPEAALRSLVEHFEEDETPFEGEREARLIARICKRAAVKAGQVLSIEEQSRLIRDLEASQSPRTCPHGRPTLIHLSVDVLERQFGRR